MEKLKKDDNNTKYKWMLFLIILVVQLAVILNFSIKKNSFFIDEIYSYGLSNSYYQPFIVNEEKDVFNKWQDKSLLNDYVTVQKGEQFSYKSVYDNQVNDVHPPLYYSILHTVCSFFPDMFSKWFGLGINILFFIITQIFLFKISCIIFKDYKRALIPIVLWGSTLAGINTVTYIRMYMLLTMFGSILMYCVLSMLSYGQTKKKLFIAYLVTILGLLTQYYFVMLAFFISACYCIYKIIKKQWKELICYASTMFAGVFSMILIFPAVFEHAFGDRFIGSTTKDNIKNVAGIFSKISAYSNITFNSFILDRNILYKIAMLLLVALIIIFVYFKIKNRKEDKNKVDLQSFILLAISSLSTFCIIAYISSIIADRYVWITFPYFAIIISIMLLFVFDIFIKNKKITTYIIFAIVAVIGISTVILRTPKWTYSERTKLREEIKNNYSQCYAIVFDEKYTAPITQELFEIEEFKGFYITEENNSNNIDDILKDKDTSKGVIVFIDISEEWSSGYNSEKIIYNIINNSSFKNNKRIYSYGLVDAYYLW